MAQYIWFKQSIAGHLQRGRISDISEALLKDMTQKLSEKTGEGLRPISVTFSGGRLETFDIHGNPFTGQQIEWSMLARRDPSRWELDVATGSNEWASLDESDGREIDDRERNGWIVVGYWRDLNSEESMQLWDSVTFFTREV